MKKYRIVNKQLCKNIARQLEKLFRKAVRLVRNQQIRAYGKRLSLIHIKATKKVKEYFLMILRQI